jgi:Flp pilus assembly protein TadD
MRKKQTQAVGGRGRTPWLFVFLLGLGVFLNTIPNELVSDDAELIPNNPAAHDPLNVKAIWGGRYWGPVVEHDTLYRPLTTWTIAANHAANRLVGRDGASPAGYHLINALLHAIVGVILYLFARQIGMAAWAALAAGLLFAAHPMHTEAVAAVVGRADLLAVALGLACLLFHDRRRPARATVALVLALFAKESAVAFLPLIVWLDLWLRRSQVRSRLRWYGVYAAVALAWFGIRHLVVGNTPLVIMHLDNPVAHASVIERGLTAVAAQGMYLRRLVLPIGLSSDYSFAQIPVVHGLLDVRLLGAVVGLGVAVWLAWRLRSRVPVATFAVVGYAILFLPVSNLLFPIGTIMGERLAYAPSVFFCLLSGLGVDWLRARLGRTAAMVMLGSILAAWAVLGIARNTTWASPEIFYRTQVRTAPLSAKARFNVARIEQAAGRLDAARVSYERAVAIEPTYADAWNNLGAVRREGGDLDGAVRAYEQALRILPSYPRACFNLGQVRYQRGDLVGAASSFETAIRLKPDYVQAISNLAGIRLEQGDVAAAERLLVRALQIDPSYRTARLNLDMLREGRANGTKPASLLLPSGP